MLTVCICWLDPLLPSVTTTNININSTTQHTANYAYPLEEMYIMVADGPLYCDRMFARCPLLKRVGFDVLPCDESGDSSGNIRACVDAQITKLVLTAPLEAPDRELPLLRDLQEIVLIKCTNIKERELYKLCRNNLKLQVLHLECLPTSLPEQCLTMFLSTCPALRCVTLEYPEVSSGFPKKSTHRGRILLDSLIRKLYPHIEHFRSNVVL